jgi:hypothetical protein
VEPWRPARDGVGRGEDEPVKMGPAAQIQRPVDLEWRGSSEEGGVNRLDGGEEFWQREGVPTVGMTQIASVRTLARVGSARSTDSPIPFFFLYLSEKRYGMGELGVDWALGGIIL